MTYNPDIHHRRSLRLPGYDYAQAGAYFVTVCSHRRELLFGDDTLSALVEDAWHTVATHFTHVSLDEFVVMPNHVHGIIVIHAVAARSPRPPRSILPTNVSALTEDLGGETPPLRAPTLGQIVAFFKYRSTRTINELRHAIGQPVWQRNYYEHVVRNEDELSRIREYIMTNPAKWSEDVLNPHAART